MRFALGASRGRVVRRPIEGRRVTLADLADILREAGHLHENCLREIETGVAFFNRAALPGDPWES